MVTILCFVALCFLGWVVLLKLEIDDLKQQLQKYDRTPEKGQSASSTGYVKGGRSYKID